MKQLKTYYAKEEFGYTGPELSPHFILSKFKMEGSSLVAWQGPADVKTDHLVDWEDRLQKDHIRAAKMLHFLGEFFGYTLREGVWLQRTLVSIVMEEMRAMNPKLSDKLIREGDDIYVDFGKKGKRAKLTVSIVTISNVSVLLHFAVNVDEEGAPVRAAGLNELMPGIKVSAFAKNILEKFEKEWMSVEWALVKVRPV